MNRAKISTTLEVPKIAVQNRQRQMAVGLPALQKSAERLLLLAWAEPARAQNSLKNLYEIIVVLVSDRRIAKLHRDFFQIDSPTDVITFQHGEIFISVETAKRQARKFGTSFRYELQLYLVHGLLHLRGFDDTKPRAARLIEKTQERILALALE